MSTCALFLCNLFRQWLLYKSHVDVCQQLFELNGGDRESIPVYYEQPLEILGESHIEYNFYRWVVYVLWLQQSDKPFYWFRKILQTHKIPSLSELHQLLWFLKRNKSLQPKLSLNDIEIPLNPVV